jgi:phosphoheptose isomerase
MPLRSELDFALRDGARLRLVLADRCGAAIAEAAAVLASCLQSGRSVLLCGNGGSAADAQHIAAELVGRYERERAGLPALALTVDTSVLTAVGNDYGFERVFARQAEALGREGDVLVAITTSGTSPNVIAAVSAARSKRMKVIGLTGARGTAFAASCDVGIVVPSTNTARVQECHISIGHLLCEAVDLSFDESSVPLISGPGTHKILARDELLALRAKWRAAGLTVVWTNGVFDILHAGHVGSLRHAKALGDVLVVGVNADDSVRALKGPKRPIFHERDRAAVLSALEPVDFVHVFSESTPERVLDEVRPEVHCKGADYAPPSGKPIPEAQIVRAYGGRIEFLPVLPERSSSAALEKIEAL